MKKIDISTWERKSHYEWFSSFADPSIAFDVKMDITLLKIRRTRLPNLCFGMQSLDRPPCAVAYAFGVFLGGNEEDLQLVVMRFFVDLQNYAPNSPTVKHNAIRLTVG